MNVTCSELVTGEPEVEPEVDLSNFLARQKLDDSDSLKVPGVPQEDDEEEVDESISHLLRGEATSSRPRKGKVVQIDWDQQLDDISREKAAADANRGIYVSSSIFRWVNSITSPRFERAIPGQSRKTTGCGQPTDSGPS